MVIQGDRPVAPTFFTRHAFLALKSPLLFPPPRSRGRMKVGRDPCAFVVNASMKNLSRTDWMSGEKLLQRIQRAGPVPERHVASARDKHQLGARSNLSQSFRRGSRRAAAA